MTVPPMVVGVVSLGVCHVIVPPTVFGVGAGVTSVVYDEHNCQILTGDAVGVVHKWSS